MTAFPRSKGWLVAWWVIWVGTLAQQVSLHTWRGTWTADNPSFGRATYIAILTPFVVSVALRWILWPKIKSVGISFAVFLCGVILSAMSALIVTFLDVPFKDLTFAVCLAGVVEFAPIPKTAPNKSLEPTR